MEKCNQKIVEFIQNEYKAQSVALHEPKFIGNEMRYLKQCIDSGFVSSVGQFVTDIEMDMARITGAKYAVAMSSGTAALHIALICAGVRVGEEVITQPLSFIATANAISYTGASAVFVDVDMDTMGMSPYSLSKFLDKNCIKKDGKCYNKISNKFISACVPMHTFGMMCKIDEIAQICDIWGINLVEDSAESLGSVYKGTHSGRFGLAGVFSFNGNKIATSGGGGMLISDDENVAKLARHLSTTAKIPHPYEYNHDYIAYNYRMPNLNTALLKAQLENLNLFLSKKRDLAKRYAKFFDSIGIKFISEPVDCLSNYWLMGVIMDDRKSRDELLKYANERSVMMRPAWRLLSELEIYKESIKDENKNAKYLADRIVNIPSSVVI